jgi:hypothetical protein
MTPLVPSSIPLAPKPQRFPLVPKLQLGNSPLGSSSCPNSGTASKSLQDQHSQGDLGNEKNDPRDMIRSECYAFCPRFGKRLC